MLDTLHHHQSNFYIKYKSKDDKYIEHLNDLTENHNPTKNVKSQVDTIHPYRCKVKPSPHCRYDVLGVVNSVNKVVLSFHHRHFIILHFIVSSSSFPCRHFIVLISLSFRRLHLVVVISSSCLLACHFIVILISSSFHCHAFLLVISSSF